jgi:hypothetical protein
MPLTSPPAIEAALVNRTSKVFKWLLEISHPQIPNSPRRFCNDTAPIISNGQTYEELPFRIQRPKESTREPSAPFQMANVTNEIGITLRSVTGRINVKFMRVLTSSPDTIETTYDHLQLYGVRVDAMHVTGTVSQVQYGREPVTRTRITPALYPSLYE